MIEAGFYGSHDEDHPESLAPGMPAMNLCVQACLSTTVVWAIMFRQH